MLTTLAMEQETYQWVTIILLLIIALGIWFAPRVWR
jgi:hypothetical protein